MNNKYYIREENGKAFMCCGKAGCPNVELLDDGSIQINDDHGSSVKMKKEEAELIHLAVSHLENGDAKCEVDKPTFGIEEGE